MLGLTGGNTKKSGQKKSGESITPIRYNVIHMYVFVFRQQFFTLLILVVVSPGQS